VAASIFSITAIYAKRLTASIDVLIVSGASLFTVGLMLIFGDYAMKPYANISFWMFSFGENTQKCEH
jgi:hypothetical protein